MSNTTKFWGFLFGGLIGAGLGLLYAPRSGDETRKIIIEDTNRITEEATKSIREAQETALATLKESQARLEALNEETRERFKKLQDIAQRTLEEQKESLEKGYSEVREVVTETEAVEG